MVKGNVVHLHALEYYPALKNETVICRKMDGTENHHAVK
jgi:hypothetical protein